MEDEIKISVDTKFIICSLYRASHYFNNKGFIGNFVKVGFTSLIIE